MPGVKGKADTTNGTLAIRWNTLSEADWVLNMMLPLSLRQENEPDRGSEFPCKHSEEEELTLQHQDPRSSLGGRSQGLGSSVVAV